MAASEEPLTNDSLFGSEVALESASIALLPVPFDATSSYGRGSANAWEAIRMASAQLDLFDPFFGEPTEAGLASCPPLPEAADLNHDCHRDVELVRSGDTSALERVNAATDKIEAAIHKWTLEQLDAHRIPALLGGEHGVSVGAIHACAQRCPGLGILHIDAHHDLRVAYEGFRGSHASAMHRALESEQVASLTSLGVRDFSHGEYSRAEDSPRIRTHYARDIHARSIRGDNEEKTLIDIVDGLPAEIYVTFDIDGLDPALCPSTGTPVPGGLSFAYVRRLLELIAVSGKNVRGFDLVEVCPPAPTEHLSRDEYDANVGARILFLLCALATESYKRAPLFKPSA